MLIIGTDEVGRGPLAGPVTAAAVVFPLDYKNAEIKDSKQLSAKKRELLYEKIKLDALAWSIVCVGHHRIDKFNIREASRMAMALAVNKVADKTNAGLVRVDGNVPICIELPQETVVGGDRKHIEISAASILAKVYRDRLMKVLDSKYPGYELGKHAGYPTKNHKQAIVSFGPSPIHRKSFRGVKEHCQAKI